MQSTITCTELDAGADVPKWALLDTSTKVVHLVRHGQATHNLHALSVPEPVCACSQGGPCVYRSEAHIDARLTKLGRRQATAVGAALLRSPQAAPEVIFVSPLVRTLETAAIALSSTSSPHSPSIIADERLRERYGVHITDKRSPMEMVAPQFPTVDFSAISPGPDSLYQNENREHPDHVAERSRSFFISLQDRPEKFVAVFAHSAFYRETMRAAFLTPNPTVARKFDTGEVRTVLLAFE